MLKESSAVLIIYLVLMICVSEIRSHGMMLSPASRSSRWRYDSTALKNYDDNALYCGGFSTQWYTHDGKCGLCGDNYGDALPRANELGGKYGGTGVIVASYNSYTADISFTITANHLGYVYFNMCNLDETSGIETEQCFQKHRLLFADGSDKLYIGTTTGSIKTTIVLPNGVSCQHCVLRWTYNAGNNWGICEDGSGKVGCGAQENFVNCADISIVSPSSRLLETLSEKINDPEIPIDVE
ncbi:uncharacterized protein LOC119682854 [Teleopsis dalmanni]|uniref:uncharacterized protein LOC119682854 n=1 Tax=Teleopsis dalmanni TaxID=139649 RepID=UPI000D32C1BF|nr:uncharacterized protein LOC119682854 [Teleopsis dalmanni]